ncbi:MAG: hypothetical protein K5793_00015 [Nitrosarchaeum sp.]|nr:hypothetical protein [Nitrosarchaeum sp.]
MKARFLIIIPLIAISVVAVLFVILPMIGTIWWSSHDPRDTVVNSESTWQTLEEQMCFMPPHTFGDKGRPVSTNTCIPLKTLEAIGCTKSILNHISRYTNLLDDDFDGTVYRDSIGLPDGVSDKEYDLCFNFLHEIRTKTFETKEPESFAVLGKINPEKDIPVFFELQLMEQEIEWKLADRSWTNTDEGLMYPAKICSHIIKEGSAEWYVYTVLEDEYSLSDMVMQREMPDNCAKFFPISEVLNEN